MEVVPLEMAVVNDAVMELSVMGQRSSEQPANALAFAKSSPAPTHEDQRQSRAIHSDPRCANGLTLTPTTTPSSDRRTVPIGSTATTGTDLMVA